MTEHGTTTRYCKHKCRCDDCRKAWAEYCKKRRVYLRGGDMNFDRDLISDLLHELCPEGLTDDCPVRQRLAKAVA